MAVKKPILGHLRMIALRGTQTLEWESLRLLSHAPALFQRFGLFVPELILKSVIMMMTCRATFESEVTLMKGNS